MNILITGGAGFVGSHLAEYHLARGDVVYVVDDLSTGSLNNIRSLQEKNRFHFTKANILDWAELDNVIGWCDVIYHMAGVVGAFKVLANPIHAMNTNVYGAARILKSVSIYNPTCKVLIASLSDVYDENNAAPSTYINNAGWNDALIKVCDETFNLASLKEKNIPVVIAKLFNVIGPRQVGHYGMVVPRFIKQACQASALTVYGNGEQKRSFCNVQDVVTVLDKLINNPQSYGQIINVGSDSEISILDLAKLIKQLSRSKADIQFIPYDEIYKEGFVEFQNKNKDITKMKALSGITPQYTLEKTLTDLIAAENKKINAFIQK